MSVTQTSILQWSLSIPKLADILPAGWEKHYDRYGLNDWRAVEKEAERMHNKTLNLISSERNRRPKSRTSEESDLYYTIRNSLLKENKKNYLLALEQLGLDQNSIKDAVSWTDRQGEFDYEHQYPEYYAYTQSFIETVLGSDLTGRTIVEIGPGANGSIVLSRFAEKGANAIGLDYDVKEKWKTKHPKVTFIEDRWENITKHLVPQSVDIIYFHCMFPFPEEEGLFENPRVNAHSNRAQSERHYRREGNKEFETHVAKATHQLLRPNGIFVHSTPIEPDYNSKKLYQYRVVFRDIFEKLGLKFFSFNAKSKFNFEEFQVEVFQKVSNQSS
jgi:hypothetical protein